MKTPKAVKLKSGNWRVQIQIDGKRHSCTAPTKKEAQDKAKQLYAGAQFEKRSTLTVGKAIDKYLETKASVLSPSTIRSYKYIRKNNLSSIININLSDLTQDDIKTAISLLSAEGKSPKTVKNVNGLLSVVLKYYRPRFKIHTKLPQRIPKEIVIPNEEEMKKIWKAAEGSKYELPILLASWCGLRQSEITGLKYGDISGDSSLHIQRAVVKGDHGRVEKQTTKTVSSDRWIVLPKPILKLIHQNLCEFSEDLTNEEILESYICPMSGESIYQNFVKICNKAGVGPFRFHDLRHFAASEAHALGVPDKYTMKRLGHSTDNMLKTVYQHTMKKKEDEFGTMIDQKMGELFESALKNSHESNQTP